MKNKCVKGAERSQKPQMDKGLQAYNLGIQFIYILPTVKMEKKAFLKCVGFQASIISPESSSISLSENSGN